MSERKLSDAETRQRRAKQAREIQAAALHYRCGKSTPAGRKAFGAGVLTAGMVWGGAHIIGLPLDVGLFLGVVALILVYRVVHNRSAYQTPEEHIYDLLAGYTPFYREGYIKLQEQARLGNVHFHWDELVDWLFHEVQVFDGDKPKSIEQVRLDKARKRFVDACEPK